VELGGKSSMSVVYSPQKRVIVAEDGEAFYSVSKDATRPFIVRAGPVTVTAVGTAFSVRRSGESVSVVVTEGAVDVAADKFAVRAEAGQRVRYDRGQLSQSLDEVPLEVATSWREGRLQFVDEPLRLVIASVNRYSEREVLIGDPAIEELRFTGTVFERGVENWLNGVASVFPVRIVSIDKRRVMIAPISEKVAPRV
jgi:transmembrane sensor